MSANQAQLYEELLKLLADEQAQSKGGLRVEDTERGKCRHERILELMFRLCSTDETKTW